MPQVRVDFVYTDCDCCYRLNEAALREITTLEPLEGREPTDLHAAAFAVYTSGSSGTPKGVVHEYGKLDMVLGVDARAEYDHKDQVVGVLTPMNTIVTILLLVPALANYGTLDIIPNCVVKDPRKLLEYIGSHGIRMMFFPPSYFRVLPKLPSVLQTVFVGSERAVEVYREGVTIFNGYGMSETGFTALYHVVEPGEIQSPVGHSYIGLQAFIVDDDRQPVEKGQSGELVLENPYTRGYLHDDDGQDTFCNGFLYTGDIARYDDKDELVVIGRKDEMIKIHGNRVEPAEIEVALKRILGLNEIAIKGFGDEKGDAVLVAYYTEHIEIDQNRVRDELSGVLPIYMQPACYMHLE